MYDKTVRRYAALRFELAFHRSSLFSSSPLVTKVSRDDDALAVAAGVFAAAWLNIGFSYSLTASVLLVVLYLILVQKKFCYVAIKTIPRDVK